MTLANLATPALLLDRMRLVRNCQRMSERMQIKGITLRPHMKTAKSAEVANIATSADPTDTAKPPITVSTLAEAQYFIAKGFTDITYAVGFAPDKLPALARLTAQKAKVTLLIDNVTATQELAERASKFSQSFGVLVEIDVGGGRGGVAPNSLDLVDMAEIIDDAPQLNFRGILGHAGQSYHCRSIDEITAVAETERQSLVTAANYLSAEGFPCDTISAGSTPTALHAQSFEGLTEMRPGVYMFHDVTQANLNCCTLDDIAVSVIATVIGHNPRSGRILIDAGALALSKDNGATEFDRHTGYGLVLNATTGALMDGLYVADVHQEHGMIASKDGMPPYHSLPIGSRVRILPIHACMTAAAFDRYHLIENGQVTGEMWDRIRGW